MGLDVYAGPISRYVAGDWMTIVEQAGVASGTPVEIVRATSQRDAVTDLGVVADVVVQWRDGLIASLDGAVPWDEDPRGDYMTDKPDWDGYGAVVLLAAYDEQPELAPGSTAKRGLRRTQVPDTDPRKFSEAPAFKAASAAPERYPTLLLGAQWCLPIAAGPTVFNAPMPNGTDIRFGRVDLLRAELLELNERTLRLTAEALGEARRAGPPPPGAPATAVAPFGLASLSALADYAHAHGVAWIMDW